MLKDSLAIYYQKKKGYKKELEKGIKIFLKKKKNSYENMVTSNIKIILKMKNQACYRKKSFIKCGKVKKLYSKKLVDDFN